MRRRAPLILVLVLLASVVIWPLLPKRHAPAGSPADLEPYSFANRLPEVHPPLAALAPSVLGDPIARIAARVEWGPPDVFYWSARHFPDGPEERDALARRLVARLETLMIGSPLLAQRPIDALAVLAEPVARGPLMRIAEAPPENADFLQVAAIRALAKYPRDEGIDRLFAQLSNHPLATVKQAAIAEVVKSEEFGDPATVCDFLAVFSDAQAVPFLQQVATRKLAGCEDACARHLASASLRARQTAILALLVLGDERGRAAAAEELARDDEPERLVLALSLYRDAKALPPIERARALAGSATGPVRRAVADALGAADPSGDDEAALQLLRRLADDEDPVVRQTAVEQLWRHGRSEAVEGWRDAVRHGHGAALREAAQFLCETLRDPVAFTIARERLAAESLSGPDQANLLSGLRHAGDLRDLPAFLERILRCGTPADVRGSERTYLSEYASLYVQTFGAPALVPLADALAKATTTRAKLAVLDALRGVAKGAPADATRVASDALFALLLDPREPSSVREAAIDSIACFDDSALGDRLYALRAQVGDQRLADRIVAIYASFF